VTSDAAEIERFDPSLDGLLNCMVREVPGWRLVRSGAGPAFELELPSRRLRLQARLRHHAATGHHAFQSPLLMGNGSRLFPADPITCLALLIEEEALVGRTSLAGRERLLGRLAQSRRNVESALAARGDDLERLFAAPLDFIAAEQALLLGHPTHPTPKSYDEFGSEEAVAFAPEFAASFPLRWYLVDRRVLDAAGAGDIAPEDAAQALFQSDPALPAALRRRVREQATERLPLPMHPWQARHLAGREPLARWLAEGLAEDLGRIGNAFRPTSSLRTVYATHAPYMLKFSLSVRVTNSKRLMEPKEWRRGKQMHQLLSGPFAASVADDAPGFTVLGEPVHLALRDKDGAPHAESAVVLRINPFRGAAANGVIPVVTLCQAHPHGGRSRLAVHVGRIAARRGLPPEAAAAAWFARFLEVALAPFLQLEAAHGLLFSAHGQNLLLRIEDDLPVAVFYRDCQGAGYDVARADHLRRWLPDLGEDAANGVDTELGHKLLAYYLVVNATFHVIASLARGAGGGEGPLLAQLRRFLLARRERQPERARFADHLLTATRLDFKGNFLTCLRDINESHAGTEQLAVYRSIPNPIAAAGAPPFQTD
jgi:N2-citryl-N6-acetyl-N6-hydroxylysine synthase